MLPAAALVLGGMLVAAGLPKVAAPRYVASALRRVVTAGPDRALLLAGRLLGCWELALGTALVVVGGGRAAVAVAACATLTCAAFTVFVALAIRRGAACGCWASLSEGPAGGAELARAAFLTGLAIDLFAGQLATATSPVTEAARQAASPPGWSPPSWPPLSWSPLSWPAPSWPPLSWPPLSWPALSWPALSWSGLAWAAALLAGMWLAMRAGAMALPVRTLRLRRQLRLQTAPGRRGRLAGQLTQLAGFVHAGTAAGRRRYLTARLAQQPPPAATGGTPTTKDTPTTRDTPTPGGPVRRARVPLPPRPPGPTGAARHPGRAARHPRSAPSQAAEGRPR